MRRWFRKKKDRQSADLEPETQVPQDVSLEALRVEAQEVLPAQVIQEPAPDAPAPAGEAVSPEPVLTEAEPEEGSPGADTQAPSPGPGLFRRMFRKEMPPEETGSPVEETPPISETAAPLEAPPAPEPLPAMEPQPSAVEIPPGPTFEDFEDDEEIIDLLDELPADDPAVMEAKKRRFCRFRERLVRTRKSLAGGLERLFLGRRQVDADVLDELEEMLITADLGVDTTLRLVEVIRDKVKRRELADADRLKEALRQEMVAILTGPPPAWRTAKPWVILMVGVNGVGKTTTIAKLAHREKRLGRQTLLIAADTFRAAAVEQLEIWGERVGAQVVKQKTGADPAAVVFDGLEAALARGVDTVYVDTAGRLHTKVNLMEELKKIHRTATKKMPGAPHEILLILDATTGQNALSQARLFHEAVGVTGIVLTKLDGTAKGGMALAVSHETCLPIRYVGVGEGMNDLQPFDAEAFVAAILD
ncbi:MAG: signal recognition particle-docking protein FtsY [Desulfobaccales bacterium]